MTKAYSEAFVNQIQALAQTQIDKYTAAITAINTKIAGLVAQQPATGTNPLVNAQIATLTGTSSTLQAAQSNLQIGMPYAQVQVAATPGSPTGLSKSKLGAIGLLAGLLVGSGIALVREQFDDRVRVSPDIDSVIDGPVLGELPEDPDVRKGDRLDRAGPVTPVLVGRGRPGPPHQPAGAPARAAEPDPGGHQPRGG